jgi:hypothetical protein
MKTLILIVTFLTATAVPDTFGRSPSQLRWPDPPKKAHMRVRLVAVAQADPRSSYFASHEVLIAEKELGTDEWSLIKLVYSFLPYQPRLSESGFDYAVIHEFSASRNTSCDETVAQMTSRDSPDHTPIRLKYSHDSPVKDLDRRRLPLPCYETTADDYGRSGKTAEPTASR